MLRGELTNLRAVERADSEIIWRWFNDPGLMMYWGASHPATSLAAVRCSIERWLEEEQIWQRPAALIAETLDGVPTGLVVCSLYQPLDQNIELSLLVDEAFQGEGLGFDILNTVISVAFEDWNLHRVAVRCEEGNDRARHLYGRIGFKPEGRLRQARYTGGAYSDIELYGLVRDDWASRG